ncbi:MAG TPA: hypothetical protein VIU34_12485 [Steroidobacter sp.]
MTARWGHGTACHCIQMFLALLLTTPLAVIAGPQVLEESFRISKPDASYDWPIAVATDGLLLRRMVNGTFTTLATSDLTITLNRSYRVRLEAIGTRLRVFVDNRLLAEASDDALDQGQAGVMMYKTQADHDNVIISSNPQTTLASYKFGSARDSLPNWDQTGTWNVMADTTYTQSDMTSGARSITGIATGDQIIHSRM